VERWELLATLAAHDLTAARVAEPHLDALAILSEAVAAGYLDGSSLTEATSHVWGVYAAEGPDRRLAARSASNGDDAGRRDGAGATDRISGAKPWCSLAGHLDRALVTAFTSDDERGLFAISLDDRRVIVEPSDAWVSRGLAEVTSAGISCRDVPATRVGPPGWYLERPGFWSGGIGVAACWYGGAVGLARRLRESVSRALNGSRAPDQIAFAALGSVDVTLHAVRAVLAEAAAEVDRRPDPAAGRILALRARAVAAAAAESTIAAVGHALGPAPLTLDPWHARQVADLQVYVRQHHAERDDAALGAALAGAQDGAA
jgi:hypothetical protein